jgi:hypothetical protein
VRLLACRFFYWLTRTIFPTGEIEPPLGSRLMANLATAAIGLPAVKVVRLAPVEGSTWNIPALTGADPAPVGMTQS